MKQRTLITAIWILFFILNIVVIVRYFNTGVLYAGNDDYRDYIKPIITLYGPYITGILAFWYFKPFPKKSRSGILVYFRFGLAIFLTLAFNFFVLYFTLNFWLSGSQNVLANIKEGTTLAAWLSILVAPVNAYYFGMKQT